MSAADTIEDVEMKEEKVRVDALQKSELNSYLGWKTISHSGIETLGWEMEPKASPTFMIWFDLIWFGRRGDISHFYCFHYFQLVWQSEIFSLLQN